MCQECSALAQQVEAQELRFSAISNDLCLEQQENLRLRRVVQAMKQREVSDAEELDARDPDTHTALKHWHTATKRTKRTDISPGSDRWKLMTRILAKKPLDYVLQVIDGAALCPYMDYGERQPTPVHGRRNAGRKDELSYIFGSDERMEACIQCLEDPQVRYQVERFRACGAPEDAMFELLTLRGRVDHLEEIVARTWEFISEEERTLLAAEAWADRVRVRAGEIGEGRRLRLVESAA